MAEKRMISKSISVSEKVNTLPDVFDILLFTWLIPHSDDFGRLTGSPAKVKALVIPMLDKSIQDVENALAALHAAEVIIWYKVNGDKYIQIVNFDKHQQGLHKRTKSKFPEYDGNNEEVPGNSGNVQEVPSELNRTEENLREKKTTTTGVGSENPFKLFQNEIGVASPTSTEMLIALVEEHGDATVCAAIREAVRQSKRKLSYVEGILRRWKTDGRDQKKEENIMSMAEWQAQEKRKKEEAAARMVNDL